MRILVFMSDNRPLTKELAKADYNSLAAAINYTYCKKHGYEFRYYQPYLVSKQTPLLHNCLDPNSDSPRHASWSKLLSMQKALVEGMKTKAYDYAVYIDSDCIFKDFEQSLETIIERHKKHDIIISNNKPSSAGPCAGFFICKANQPTLEFVTDWYDVNIPKQNTARLWEQSALNKLYKNYDVALMDNGDYFHERPRQFLRHINSYSDKTRVPYLTRFLSEKGIDFDTTARKIPVHAFRTTTANKRAKRFTHRKKPESSNTAKAVKTVKATTRKRSKRPAEKSWF